MHLLVAVSNSPASRLFDGERPAFSIARLFVAANVLALALALVLPGPVLTEAAESFLAWCRIR